MSQSPLRRVADTTTGEVHLVSREKRAAYDLPTAEDGTRHMVISTVARRRIRQARYKGAVLSVLWYALDECNELNQILAKQRQIAEELGLSEASVSTAVRQLIADGHFYRDEYGILHLNPQTACTGSSAHQRKLVARMPVCLRQDASVRHLHPVS